MTMMETGEYVRKLAAILSADVEGYSRLMEADELLTIATLKQYRAVFRQRIEGYRGRIVDAPGDNILAEFSSVMDAVRCAFDIQKELELRNEKLPAEKRMRFRIGINIGDIIQEGKKIYGDGVNIASRVEGLAEGGGVSISGTVYEHIKHKLQVWHDFIGTHNVKNISDPIHVYRIYPETAPNGNPGTRGRRRPVVKLVMAGLVCLVAAIAIVVYATRPAAEKDPAVQHTADGNGIESDVDTEPTVLSLDGKPLYGEWNPYAGIPATSAVHVDKAGSVIWTYTLPETDKEIYAGIGCYFDPVSIADRRIDIAIESANGLPLEIRFYSVVPGFSSPEDENTWVPGEVVVKVTPGSHTIIIHPADIQVPLWWRNEVRNQEVVFSNEHIHLLEIGAVVNEEVELLSDRVVIRGVRLAVKAKKR